MRIKLPAEDVIGFQMAPMIDITFLLIIFFMVAAQQTQIQFKKIDVPIALHGVVPDNAQNRGTITIAQEDELYIGARSAKVEEIQDSIRDGVANDPSLSVFLRVDSRVPHRIVRKVMEEIAAGGVTDIIFSTYQSDK